jgi:hypothetical protein
MVMICTGMCRVFGSCLSRLRTLQPSMSGQEDIEGDRRREVLGRKAQSVAAPHGDDPFEAAPARQVEEDARVVRVVLDDEERRDPGRELVAVVGDLLEAGAREDHRHARRGGGVGLGRLDRSGGPSVDERQVEREGAPVAGQLCRRISPPEQGGQLAADGEPEARSSVLARRARVGLLEGPRR